LAPTTKVSNQILSSPSPLSKASNQILGY
jgi:hypothetical protein